MKPREVLDNQAGLIYLMSASTFPSNPSCCRRDAYILTRSFNLNTRTPFVSTRVSSIYDTNSAKIIPSATLFLLFFFESLVAWDRALLAIVVRQDLWCSLSSATKSPELKASSFSSCNLKAISRTRLSKPNVETLCRGSLFSGWSQKKHVVSSLTHSILALVRFAETPWASSVEKDAYHIVSWLSWALWYYIWECSSYANTHY